jgi:hypothetical protein
VFCDTPNFALTSSDPKGPTFLTHTLPFGAAGGMSVPVLTVSAWTPHLLSA